MYQAHKSKYQAAPATDVVVSSKKAILHRILIGADVASSVIEVSDSATDGNGNIKLRFAGSTLMTSTNGVIEVGAVFDNGIASDIVNQTHVTFIWEPLP